jgi:hypothetical protein
MTIAAPRSRGCMEQTTRLFWHRQKLGEPFSAAPMRFP